MRQLVTIAATPGSLRSRASAKGGLTVGTGNVDAAFAAVPAAVVPVGEVKRRVWHAWTAFDAMRRTANYSVVNVAIKTRAFSFGG